MRTYSDLRRGSNGDRCVDRDGNAFLGVLAVDLDSCPRIEQNSRRRSTEVKHSQFIAAVYVLAFVSRDFTGRNLRHSYSNEAHQPDGIVVGFNKYELSSGGVGRELERFEVRW